MSTTGIDTAYELAKERYAALGVDTDAALKALADYSISIHCWQADDVSGFEKPDSALAGGGIQATGNHPGKARTIAEARADYEKAFSLVPGKHRLNLHASYGDFSTRVDRDAVEAGHFASWIDWAKAQGVGLDFNSTCFSHPKASTGFTLSSKDKGIRDFWIEHVKRCRAIADAMGRALGSTAVHNVWIPDGAKDITVDRAGHRRVLAEALDACFEKPYEGKYMKDAVECKLFGIGSEWFVVGSHEFYMGYAMSRKKLLTLDLGHFHPTESVADKLPSLFIYFDELLLHVSRPIRWDSDHVVILDDGIRELSQEIVRRPAGKSVYIALDFFDASINRVGAYVTGIRATLQGLLLALLEPRKQLVEAEEAGDGFKRLALLEAGKTMPFGAVWDYYCEKAAVPVGADWIGEVLKYEKDVTSKRQ